MSTATDIWLVAYIATGSSPGSSLRWSRPYATPREARKKAKRLAAEGSPLALVILERQERREVYGDSSICPASARRLIGHYEEILESLEPGR